MKRALTKCSYCEKLYSDPFTANECCKTNKAMTKHFDIPRPIEQHELDHIPLDDFMEKDTANEGLRTLGAIFAVLGIFVLGFVISLI